MRSVPLTSHGCRTMPGIWSLGNLWDSVLSAKAGQWSSKSNYLRSSAALDVTAVDCANNLWLDAVPSAHNEVPNSGASVPAWLSY